MIFSDTEPTDSTQPAAAKSRAAKRTAGGSRSGTRPASEAQDGKAQDGKALDGKTQDGKTNTAEAKAARPKTARPKTAKAATTAPTKATSSKATSSKATASRSTAAEDAATKSTAAKSTAPKSAASKSTAAKRKAPARPKTRYAVGQEIVYPLQGVGRIERLEERDFQEKPTLYYVVYLDVSDMTIMIPVDKADELGVRAIVSKRKAERALRLIAEDFDPIPTDWKLRYQMNLDLLKRGAVNDIASVVRSLSYRSRIKELPILERKLYDSAHRLLVDEVSYSLGKEKGVIEKLIEDRLANVKQKGDA